MLSMGRLASGVFGWADLKWVSLVLGSTGPDSGPRSTGTGLDPDFTGAGLALVSRLGT